ncbi:competence protein CoiA family protein [Ekhidna sp.]|uniref:competence protein CoiA family protein n=1 Tax=Ekhidna sp. TaxID=2608089 RepID=UPI003296D213
MNSIKYSYAKKECGEIVGIDEVNNENRGRSKFSCISCNAELIPRLGSKKVHHFAHKSLVNCSGETYLHSLAKKLFIKEYELCLNSQVPFNLEYESINKCSFLEEKRSERFECQSESCKTRVKNKFNLASSFTQVFEEKRDGEFIPDIMLFDPKRSEKIYIEMAVTHQCEQEKIDSGVKIIEFNIKSEDDLKLFRRRSIELTVPYIARHNFLTKGTEINCRGNCDVKTTAFYLFKSGKSILLNYPISTHIRNYKKGNILYLSLIGQVPNDFEDDWIGVHDYLNHMISAYEKGFPVKNCHLCRYHALNTNPYNEGPIFCKADRAVCESSNEAVDCEKFRPDPIVFA